MEEEAAVGVFALLSGVLLSLGHSTEASPALRVGTVLLHQPGSHLSESGGRIFGRAVRWVLVPGFAGMRLLRWSSCGRLRFCPSILWIRFFGTC